MVNIAIPLNKGRALGVLLGLGYVIYFVSALILPFVADVAAGLLLLFGIAGAIYLRKASTQLDRDEWLLIGAFALFSVLSVISFFYWPYRPEAQLHLEDHLVFICLLPLFLCLRNFCFNFNAVVFVFALTGGMLGVISIAQYFSMLEFGEYLFAGDYKMSKFWMRPSGGVNPTRYAAISLVIATFSLNALLFYPFKSRLWKGVLVFSVVMGLLACFLTQVRGAWLAIPILVGLYVYWMYKLKGKRSLFIPAVVLIFGVVAISQLSFFSKRIELAFENYQSYINGETHTSLGARFDMFKVAVILISEKPIWGYGLNAYKKEATEVRVGSKGISAEVGRWNNPHNEFLQVLVEKGLIGLLSLLFVFIAPFLLFRRARKRCGVVGYYGVSGFCLVVVYLIVGQSVALFEHDVFNHFYTLMVLFFYSQIKAHERVSEEAAT